LGAAVPLDYRLLVITANILANQLGIPIPVIPTLIIAGALVAQGNLSATALSICALSACIAADSAWFLAGRIYGGGVMKLLCRISLTPDSCVSDTQARFERWGSNVLIVAKFVPGLSLVAPPLAGATRMPWLRFLIFSTVGSAAWLGLAVLGGVIFRRQIEQLMPQMAHFGTRALSVAGVLLVLYVLYKWWERKRFYSALEMARINVEDLYALMGLQPAPLIVDVRSSTAVNLDPRRIPGALHIPLHGAESHLKDLPRDREVISYCTCPNEASAAQVAKLLMKNGFKRVRPLHGGLDAWVAAGHTVELIQVEGAEPRAVLMPKEGALDAQDGL
jgi:membrane protein DedA with SNARE-associated domain/rhodanese-related sulfurtransferase